MADPVAQLNIPNVQVTAPESWPGGYGYGFDGLRDAVNDSIEEIGDTINNIIIAFPISAIGAGFDGGGSVLTTGLAVEISIPYNCVIESMVLIADVSGSVELEIEKSAFDDYDTLTSIVASAPPTLSSEIKTEDDELADWTTEITAGDILRFSITSVSTITRASITLKVQKTP